MSNENPAKIRSKFHYLQVDGLERRYLVYAPAGTPSAQRLPVVIMLHGAGATARWTLAETGWNVKAEDAGFLVVLPEALPVNIGEATHITKNPRLWSDGDGVNLTGQRARDDLGFLKSVLNDLPNHYTVDLQRFYLTGFSNGAVMAFRLACEISDRLAALAPVAGHCRVLEPRLVHALPTLYIIGLEDPLVPFEGGSIRSPWGEFRNQPSVQDSLAKWAAALGCPAQARDLGLRDGVHSLVYGPGHNGPELLVKLVEGQGHHWPGGAGGWSEAMAGKMTSHIDATHAIWSFFAGHQLEVS